jgi:hypothetical protein
MTTVNVADPIHLDALGPRGAYRTRVPSSVTDVAGTEVARLSLVPPLFVTRAMAALRQAGPIPAADLDGLLAAAADAFASGTIGGLNVREYERLVSRTSGTPLSVVHAATDGTARFVRQARSSAWRGRPVGAVGGLRDSAVREGHAVWVRQGDVFAVNASGNHPGVHRLWLEALALVGRPSCPFSGA